MTKPMVLADRSLSSVMRVFEDYDHDKLIELIVTDLPLARVVSDATAMLIWPSYAPIAAGRVADSIVRMISDAKGAQAWDEMRRAVGGDEAYLRLLTDRSKGPRHGHRQAVDGATNKLLATRAWTLLDRYLAYRMESGVLAESAYPVLTG